MSSRNRNWTRLPPARETVGFTATTAIARIVTPPKDSWWTRARSREDFRRLVRARSLEAGWVGKHREEG